jgi:hypothetical protein
MKKVTGAEVGENVMVYTEDGVFVKSVPVVNQQTDIDLQKNGLYIIKVGDKVVKLSH